MPEVSPRLTGMFTPPAATIELLLDIKNERAPPQPFRDIFLAPTIDLVNRQKKAGFPTLSDGQMMWGDLYRPVFEGMAGVELGSMTRWLETNGFGFPPKIVDVPSAGESALPHYLFPGVVNGEMSITVMGPYTMVRMSENAAGVGEDLMLRAFTDQLQNAMPTLVASGVRLVEFCEPALAYDAKTMALQEDSRQSLLGMAREAYEQLRVRGVRSIMQFPDADFHQVAGYVMDFPVDGYGVDLTETVEPSRELSLAGKILSAGVLSAWSSIPANLDFAQRRTKEAIEAWNPDGVYVTTSGELVHTISHPPAVDKIYELGRLAERLST